MSIADRIRVKDVRLLSDNHYTLKTTTFEWRRADGQWQTQHRESYDRGNGATLLPYSPHAAHGGAGAPVPLPGLCQRLRRSVDRGRGGIVGQRLAGGAQSAPRRRRETGYRLREVHKVFEAS